MVKGVLDFIENELCLGPDFCVLEPGDVIRVRPNRGGKARGEVAVTFPDIETRDLVRSSAKNLAGKSSMGMRLEIPEHLRPSLRNLESVSFDLKKTVPEMKRNIKFDDAVMDLVLDVKLGDDRPWQKIRPENARAARRNPRLDEAGNQEELDPSAIETMLRKRANGPTSATGANRAPLGARSSVTDDTDPMDGSGAAGL